MLLLQNFGEHGRELISSEIALRLLRLSLLEGNLPHMRLSNGALLAGAVNVPLLSLIASVLAWLFTSAAIVQVLATRLLCKP